MTTNAKVKYLKDYRQPNYWADTIELEFDVMPQITKVISHTKYRKNSAHIASSLTLNGSAKLIDIKLDNNPITDYVLQDNELTITNLPDTFILTIETEVDPFNDKSCMGLYASNGNLFTQCEPEGFRKITYYQDRPDIMAIFTTTITADSKDFPILLSNGNKISEKTLANGKTQVVWSDPYKKPSYLFALVAGKFSKIDDFIITRSGRKVNLEIYSEPASIKQCYHCLESLKRAIKWDEARFNLEYDLDTYMIVASGDFNMGAMENKGLNIFNTKYVLADSKTATDTDFINVEAVVGHEYFHNWTGNRVTCRDWFQLSLKEGLTVFRDQEFTSDLHSRPVKRIQDVKALRQLQFTEDASPLAHSVRPESYIEMNNFYTMTVYEKGAEVVRMYQTILGKSGFNLGMDLYFARHDGSAVTCEDFCMAMADANKFDLSQFMLWYSQAGTPTIKVTDSFDPNTNEYTLTIAQTIPDTPAQTNKKPMLIPVSIGLLGLNGEEMEPQLISGEVVYPDGNCVLLVKNQMDHFKFKVASKPTPSILREFSAPVIVNYAYSTEQLLTLAANDKDSFNRWEALQTLYRQTIDKLYQKRKLDEQLVDEELIEALRKTLINPNLDPSIKSLAASLPSFAELSAYFKPVDVLFMVDVINFVKSTIATKLESIWLEYYHLSQTSVYDLKEANLRSLKNTALNYLLACKNWHSYLTLAETQYLKADNMTDKFAVLVALNDLATPLRSTILAKFRDEFHSYPLVMDKWFLVQSQSQLPETLATVKNLLEHPEFDKLNPNKLYALVRAFTANPKHFHDEKGYQFIEREILRIDHFNSSVASRIAHGFSQVTSLEKKYQEIAKPVLLRILAKEEISKDVYELISKTVDQLA